MPSDEEIEAALAAADFCTNADTRKWMRAALLAAEAVRAKTDAAMSSWRDVATDPPPRDGTRVLLWNAASKRAHIGEWDEDDEC